MSVNTAVTPQGNIVFITKNLVIRLRLRPIRHYWWKEEGPGEDFLCPWSEEEDGDEDKEQEGWELVCRPLYSVIAAIASCWANRTPESQHGRFSVKLTAHWKPERPVWKQLVSCHCCWQPESVLKRIIKPERWFHCQLCSEYSTAVVPSLLRTNCVKMILLRLQAPLTSSLRRGIHGQIWKSDYNPK